MNSCDIPATPGIYRITCIVTKKIYIGSAINLRARWQNHCAYLRQNKHHNPKLQNAWNKYGPDAFVFEVLEIVLIPDLLTAREQYWFSKLKPFGNKGFNLAPIAGSSLGRVVSEATREKIGAPRRGKPGRNRGRKMTSEQLARHKLTHPPGREVDEETRRNMGKGQTGRVHSLKSREKRGLTLLGHAPTNVRTFILTAPDGTEYVINDGLPKFCKERSLSPSCLGGVARGERKQHKGWTARYPEVEAC